MDTELGASGEAVNATDSPLGGEAGDRDEEVERLVPDRGNPGFLDRGVSGGEAGDECGEAVAVHEFAAGLSGELGEPVAVGLQLGELVGSGLGGPSGLAPADLGAFGTGGLGGYSVGAGFSGDVLGGIGAGLTALGPGVDRERLAAGEGD